MPTLQERITKAVLDADQLDWAIRWLHKEVLKMERDDDLETCLEAASRAIELAMRKLEVAESEAKKGV